MLAKLLRQYRFLREEILTLFPVDGDAAALGDSVFGFGLAGFGAGDVPGRVRMGNICQPADQQGDGHCGHESGGVPHLSSSLIVMSVDGSTDYVMAQGPY